MNAFRAGCVAAVSIAINGPAMAATITVEAERDNTIFSESGTLSNGSGPYLFAGNTAAIDPTTRRGLIAFDVSAIPTEVQIQSVTLTLHVWPASFVNGPWDFSLHRLLADWGEAGSNSGGTEAAGGGGLGAPAEPGDATWTSNFLGASTWSTNGGDVAGLASATTAVGAPGPYQWSGPGMVADVQSWVDGDTANYGWLLRGDESTFGTARRFRSSEFAEDPALRPSLEVTYAVVPLPAAAFMLGPAVVGLAVYGSRGRRDRRRSVLDAYRHSNH